MQILCGILATFVILEIIAIAYLVKGLGVANTSLDYYRSRLMKMVANDSLIHESFAIISEAYGIEEGDLKNYISEKQKEGDNK